MNFISYFIIGVMFAVALLLGSREAKSQEIIVPYCTVYEDAKLLVDTRIDKGKEHVNPVFQEKKSCDHINIPVPRGALNIIYSRVLYKGVQLSIATGKRQDGVVIYLIILTKTLQRGISA